MAGQGPAPELNEDQMDMLKERMRFYNGSVTTGTVAVIICFILTFAVIFALKGYLLAFWAMLFGCIGIAAVAWLFAKVAPR